VTDNASRIVLSVLVLVFGAAFEDLLPRFCGVGFPVLLTVVQFVAPRRSLRAVVLMALAAGAAEESLSSLEPMTCVSYFLAAALVSRHFGFPLLMAILTYPCLQVWLAVWTPGMGGGVFNRIVLSVPVGMVTAFVTGAVVDWLGRKAAIDERS